jgi:hypothetical protein
VINIQLNLLLFNTNIDVNLLTKGSNFLTYQENITILTADCKGVASIEAT